MAKIMARENAEEWGTSAAVEHETIRSIVEGYAERRIKLPPINGKTSQDNIRNAPSYSPVGRDATGISRRIPATSPNWRRVQ